MKHSTKLSALIVGATLISFIGHVAGQQLSADELTQRALHRRAVEAVIWAMPLVNFDRMLQAAIQNGGAANQVVYWSQPVNSRNQTLTPNPDTIYLNPFYDTRKGPVVLEIPPAEKDFVIVGSVDNAWQNALEDVGPAGVDKGKGGKYLITPPGYKDKPPEGYIVLPSDTYQGFVITRSNFKSRTKADIDAAVAYGKRIKIYQLGGTPDSTVYVDVYDKPFDATIPYDSRFFESLDRMIQIEPWLARDKVMIDMLKSVGIEKGKPFNPDAKTKTILDQTAGEAHAEIDLNYEKLFVPPYFENSHWAVPGSQAMVAGMSNSFADPIAYPVSDRATSYSMGYFSAKHLGAGQFYLLSSRDRDGQRLSGQHTYRLNVPANAPVKQYWSATAYSRETHALIPNTARSSRGSNSPDIQKNTDGSVDVYFGPTAPPGKEGNWVPTGQDFEILFRLYGPEKPLFDKTWKLPDVEEVK